MAPGTEWVEQFLGQLKYTLSPHGQKNLIPLQRGRLEDLQARGKQCDERERFPPWDKQYYERLLQQDLKIDQLRISEFFPLHQTMVKMLGIFASSLGLRFDPVPADRLTEETIWHPTVGLFSVWDTKNDEFVGYLYHDLLWREHKYRGNQSVNIQCVLSPFHFHTVSAHVPAYRPLGLSATRWNQTIPIDNPDVFFPDSHRYQLRLASAFASSDTFSW